MKRWTDEAGVMVNCKTKNKMKMKKTVIMQQNAICQIVQTTRNSQTREEKRKKRAVRLETKGKSAKESKSTKCSQITKSINDKRTTAARATKRLSFLVASTVRTVNRV